MPLSVFLPDSSVRRSYELASCCRAHYADGKLVGRDGDSADPKSCAGTVGTTITCEDLFFNVPNRRKAMKSPSEEYHRVVDVVGKYAIHYSGTSINVKKHAENRSEINTPRNASIKDNIRLLHGAKIVSELLDINVEIKDLDAKVRGFVQSITTPSRDVTILPPPFRFVTGPNYSGKKISFILFINNRLVDCAPLKKAIETIYAQMFQRSVHPWVYLSLSFPPQKIDPNVHPTKSEVRFLNQDEVIAEVAAQVASELDKSNASRTFSVEGGASWSVVPHVSQSSLAAEGTESSKLQNSATTPEKQTPSKPYQHQMIRTDSKAQKLDSFLSPTRSNLAFSSPLDSAAQPVPPHVPEARALADPDGIVLEEIDVGETGEIEISVELSRAPGVVPKRKEAPASDTASLEPPRKLRKFSLDGPAEPTESKPVEEIRLRRQLVAQQPQKVRLTSVLNLVRAFENAQHVGLRNLFSNAIFVGCFDATRALVQYENGLLICNLSELRSVLDYAILSTSSQYACSCQLAYQEALHRLSELRFFRMATPLPLIDLVKMALSSHFTPTEEADAQAQGIVDLLRNKADLLKEYFSVTIDSNSCLTTLPELVDEYPPYPGNVPQLLVELATNVNWKEEQSCLDGIARVLGKAYTLHEKQFPQEPGAERPSQSWICEHVLLPSMRLRFSPPAVLATNGAVVQITSLEKLYKVFERC